MNDQTRQLLLDALDLLAEMNAEGLRPTQAQARLRPLQGRYPGHAIDMVWEEEAYDGSVHYDLLLNHPGQGTVSLSLCSEPALPWPLRGVHRWSEKDLVRVNNTVLPVSQAIACLDFVWEQAPLVERLVNTCLVEEALARDPVELSDAEVQGALDAFRRARGLCSASNTETWMQQHGMTHERLEKVATDEATVAKLRDRVVAGRVEPYFEAHREDFDTVCCARLEFPDEASASRACAQFRSGRSDFFDLAQRLFLDRAQHERAAGELFVAVRRGEASPELRSALFAAPPGATVGPVPGDKGHTIFRVLSHVPACLNEKTYSAIKGILFDEWLAQRRAAARIEWYWGNAACTTSAR
jgi:putative peptide maturation system protein